MTYICKYEKCKKTKVFESDYCFDHKCRRQTCNNHTDDIYIYCMKCACINVYKCQGLKLKNNEKCEFCLVDTSWDSKNYNLCKYNLCTMITLPNKLHCNEHTCTIDSCENMLPLGFCVTNVIIGIYETYYIYSTPFKDPNHNNTCSQHWKSENHTYYPDNFKKSVRSLMLVLKRKEIIIPKFIKFEIIKKL